jgi:rhamnogalacturonyl hydrolase YesR
MDSAHRLFTRRAFQSALVGAPVFAATGGRPCRFIHAALPTVGEPTPIAGFAEHSIDAGAEGLLLRWPSEVRGAAGFGFAFGHDYREFGSIAVELARSGRRLATVNVSLAARFDPYLAQLAEADASAASRDGLRLRAEGGSARRSILSASAERRREAPALHPFLLLPGTLPPEVEYARRLRSLDVLQDFDWRAGCVTEGLHALNETASLRRYLGVFLEQGGADALRPFQGVEQTLPAAAILRIWRGHHPALDQALELWNQRRHAAGHLQDGANLVAEANYTAAYPMALLGVLRDNRELRERAVLQLRAARDRLVDESGVIHLRHDERTGERTYAGWARGVAWYLLGMAATLETLPQSERPPELLDELRRALGWALQYQRDDGLWCGFLREPGVAPDTSGSAGIAAAVCISARLGAAEAAWIPAARRALQGCRNRLSLHGFLTGVSPTNKREGGPAFQRSPHRVSMQFGMGLLAILLARGRLLVLEK